MIVYLCFHINNKTPCLISFCWEEQQKYVVARRPNVPHSSTENYNIVINIHNVSTSHKNNSTIYGLHFNNRCYLCCHFLIAKLVLESMIKNIKSDFFKCFWTVGKIIMHIFAATSLIF